MSVAEILKPVSFHLRNFNQYVQLDLSASTKGNLTLIGENAAGKTTLANCFFPMLIDGSIATPSFNPAKGTDRLNQATTPHSSTRDTRTFDSMLLGWGDGAMKARTGYSYLCLQSTTRQVILGLGAYRAVGETRKPTWWFIVISQDTNNDLVIHTTDEQGQSLSREDFVAANQQLGNQFHVFNQGTAYCEFAADKVYGFSDTKNLAQLATTYRLLASPILTAGNARFAPIQAALKNAQEGIDEQVIADVASAQREVNRITGVHDRIEQGQKRLAKLKAEIFWRNLNRINELIVVPYGKQRQEQEKWLANQEKAKLNLKGYQGQLILIQPEIERLEQQVTVLQQRLAEQKVIKEQRQSVEQRIQSLNQLIGRYQELQRQLQEQETVLAELTQQQQAALDNQQQLEQTQIRPLRTKIEGQTEGLSELITALAEADLQKYNHNLQNYIRAYRQYLEQHRQLIQSQAELSADVKIVGEMSTEMQQHIEQRTQGLLGMGRVREGLIQDNDQVHSAGAAKMNQRFKPLEEQIHGLLVAHPDLLIFLRNTELWHRLQDQARELAQLVMKQIDMVRANEQLAYQVTNAQDKLANTQQQLEQPELMDFIPTQAKEDLAKLQARLTELVIDNQLLQKLATAKRELLQFNNQKTELMTNCGKESTKISLAQQQISDLKAKLKALVIQLKADLKVLTPYFPNEVILTDMTALLKFVQQNRSEVRNHPFSDLTDRIGYQIHHNNENGYDVYALDSIFEERGRLEIASAMRQQRSLAMADLTIVAFDINQAQQLLASDEAHVRQALTQKSEGNEVAQEAYVTAAATQIADQYDLIANYNEMLAHGVHEEQGVQLKVELEPTTVSPEVIVEACNMKDAERPALLAEVQRRLQKLASDLSTVNDDEKFMTSAYELLDIRQWSEFKVLIHRRQSKPGEFEIVDDKFVQSGGSGAEKAQAMVLPLLLVPKMILHRSQLTDTPHLVMFDEFADKLDPETAKSFAQTIDHFGFNFIATMPSGAQNKILADGVANIAYDVIAPRHKLDGQFHANIVRPALIWQQRVAHD